MKLKFIKKFITTVVYCALLFVSLSHMEVFAALENIIILGGSYQELLEEKNRYLDSNPFDNTIYECHHLIAKEALNRWGDCICERARKFHRNAITCYNEFLVDDLSQEWAPSITMEKTDHEKTLSYYNPITSSATQKERAEAYIDEQAERIICNGDIIGVLKYEIAFIQRTFGHKYDRAIREVWEYINSLECRHRNGNTLVMRNPDNYRMYFYYYFGC